MKPREGSFLDRRRAGVLLHPTSLPGVHFPTQKGDLGANAFRFIDLLVDCGVSVWQILPLVPTHADNSPYFGLSSHAGNPLLINLELLVEQGLLAPFEYNGTRQQYGEFHQEQLVRARTAFFDIATDDDLQQFKTFIASHHYWIEDYALYQALRNRHRIHWTAWPVEWRDREILPQEIDRDTHPDLFDGMQQALFEQYLFFSQWHAVRAYANDRDVLLFGDIPIFVAHDSADVWARRDQFNLDETGNPSVVAGVPPDYFSETGQRWGNPLFDWKKMKRDNFSWWTERLKTQLELYDLVRIDHFRGFEAYWEIPADSDTAIDGKWVQAPGDDLFVAMQEKFGKLPVIAEDLGLITDKVTAMRERYGFPGMKILQFAFDGSEDNPYLPQFHEINSVVYTGTHDNDTSLGWYDALPNEVRARVMQGLDDDCGPMPWPLLKLALSSVSDLVMLPMQDVLGLGSESRMNTPGTVTDKNWQWQFSWDQVDSGLVAKLCGMVEESGRA